MNISRRILKSILAGLSLLAMQSVFAQQAPHLQTRGKATQLIVNGKPFLILGGELHNSSSSALSYLNQLGPP